MMPLTTTTTAAAFVVTPTHNITPLSLVLISTGGEKSLSRLHLMYRSGESDPVTMVTHIIGTMATQVCYLWLQDAANTVFLYETSFRQNIELRRLNLISLAWIKGSITPRNKSIYQQGVPLLFQLIKFLSTPTIQTFDITHDR